MAATVNVEDRDGVRHVTIDRPPVNALSMVEYDALGAALELDPGVRVVSLRSTGPVFSAGQDLRELSGLDTPDQRSAYLVRAAQGVAAVAACPVPVVSVLDGPAIGAGALLAASSDIVLATPSGSIALPELRYGVRLGRALMAGTLPEPLLAYAFATGAPLGARRLHNAGMVAELLAVEEVEARVGEVLTDLLALPDRSLSWLRRRALRATRALEYLAEARYAGG